MARLPHGQASPVPAHPGASIEDRAMARPPHGQDMYEGCIKSLGQTCQSQGYVIFLSEQHSAQ